MASTIKVNNIQNQCGANIANKCGSTITLGASGDTITLACGASQTGFGRTGTVDWDTTAKTASFTAVSGTGYFVNTTSGAITVTLPAGSAGDIVGISDYASTFQTNNVTITPNGTDKINGENENATLSTQGIAVSLVYVDATRGWKSVTGSDNDTTGAAYITATGGTITTCGNFKIHTFTSPGTFCVSSLSNTPANNEVSYLVVAGGGGANDFYSGGGGAGGFRENKSGVDTYTASPLNGSTPITVTATSFPITVGGGGGAPPIPSGPGDNGSNSVFSSITSTGGGGSGAGAPPSPISCAPGSPGGSGGGAGGFGPGTRIGGNGNTPPVSPPQGNTGGCATAPATAFASAGGGGATALGGTPSAPTNTNDGDGGAGAGTNINPATGESGPGCLQYYSGGGGGGVYAPGLPATTINDGGVGGGGDGSRHELTCVPAPSHNGTANTGGGAGGGGNSAGGYGGGSGIVIIRYKYQ